MTMANTPQEVRNATLRVTTITEKVRTEAIAIIATEVVRDVVLPIVPQPKGVILPKRSIPLTAPKAIVEAVPIEAVLITKEVLTR
jgi:hypothetical protein